MRAVISAMSGGLVVAGLLVAGHAQAPDYKHATELYDQANAELADGRYADAARDFGAAYDITRDPVLFFKIGSANEKAGHCDVAVVYYGRYLKEASPSAKFVAVTQERIEACGGSKADIGSGASGGGNGSGSGVGSGSGASGGGSGDGGGSAARAPVVVHASPSRNGAWLFVGGALASITVGAVLAYSASSSEQDVKDLYVKIGGVPPVYDPTLAKRYQDLIDEGHRYQYLSWASFGIAAGCAVGAAILFVHASHEDSERVSVTPLAAPHEAGVAATVHF